MQIKNRVIENNAVDDRKIRLRNDEALRARNFANTLDQEILKVNQDDLVEFLTKPISSHTPSGLDDLVNVAWVQEYVSGIVNLKDPVKAATTSNIDLQSPPPEIDGYTYATGDRILVKDQTEGEENGVYVFNGSIFIRAEDFDGNPTSEVRQGNTVDVLNGTVHGQRRFVLVTANQIFIGTTPLVFVEIPKGATIPQQANELITLTSTDISNQSFELAQLAIPASIKVFFAGVLQVQGVDYQIDNDGAQTVIEFDGDLATSGAIELVAGDELVVYYERE